MFIYTRIIQYRYEKSLRYNLFKKQYTCKSKFCRTKQTKQLSLLIVRFVSVFTTEANRLDRNR